MGKTGNGNARRARLDILREAALHKDVIARRVPAGFNGRWTGSYRISSTSTFDRPFGDQGTLAGARTGTWTAQHVVCQVQTMLIAPGYTPPSVPCRDPRVNP